MLCRACMLRLVPNAVNESVGMASSKPWCRPPEGAPANVCPSGSSRERFKRYTPEKMTRKPQRREIVFTGSEVLKPLKRMNEAHRVNVVNVT
jgi:hypothetical protein